MRHPFGETVTIHPMTQDGTDPYGNPVRGFGEPIDRTNCAVSPRVEAEEIGNNRSMVIDGFNVYDSVDCPVGPHDEVTIRGLRHKVDGEVAKWFDPLTGKQFGAVYAVKRVDG